MRLSKLVIFLLLMEVMAAGTMLLTAQTPATAPKPAADSRPIDQLSWFVGGTWTTEEKNGNGGTLLVKFTCTWAETKQALLYKVSFEADGKETPQYDGMFVWNPEKKAFNLWQVNRKGEIAEGTMTVNGNEMDQLVRVVHPDGGLHFLKAHYTHINQDQFQFKAWFRLSEAADWQDALDIVYKRPPASATVR